MTITIKSADLKTIKHFLDQYQDFLVDKKDSNILYFFKKQNKWTISIFSNNTIFIQGNDLNEFSQFKNQDKIKTLKPTNQDIIGCDEVGVGDFFGGLVTCACYASMRQQESLNKKFLINDSKKIKDATILKIAPEIMKECIFEAKVISPSEYNKLESIYHNAHVIKSLMHNYCIKKIKSKVNKQVVIDKYVDAKKYYEYLTNARVNLEEVNYFIEKADSLFFNVSLASIIARYHFLKQNQELSSKINRAIPLGCNHNVITFAKNNFKSIETISDFAKVSFKTIKEIFDEKK